MGKDKQKLLQKDIEGATEILWKVERALALHSDPALINGVL